MTGKKLTESSFKQGDSVQLGATGTGMVVLDVGRDTGLVMCQWIGAGGKLRMGAFTFAELRPYYGPPNEARSFADSFEAYTPGKIRESEGFSPPK